MTTTTPALGPDEYPIYEEDVTAERIAGHLTKIARLHAAAVTPELLYADPQSTEGYLYRALTAAFINEFAVVYLLRTIAERDAALGHRLAVELHRLWSDGGTIHELLWEWAYQYGQNPQAVPGE